jgi:hypothetical protein
MTEVSYSTSMSESTSRKKPTCSHCLEEGHSKAALTCPLRGKEAAPRPEKKEMSTIWTEKTEYRLKILVNACPLHIPWDTISKHMGHTAAACETRYNGIVPLEDQIHRNISKLNKKAIHDAMAEKRWTCADCHDPFYNAAKEWRGASKCDACYKVHEAEIAELWGRINVDFTDKKKCLFCERDKSVIAFNFDHINMFDKGDSICAMVSRGDSYDVISEEIIRCQIICCSCHAIVTKVEHLVGFIRVKKRATRALNSAEGLMPERVEEIRQDAFILYKETIEPIYPIIMTFVRGELSG